MVWTHRILQNGLTTQKPTKWFDHAETYKMVWPYRNLQHGWLYTEIYQMVWPYRYLQMIWPYRKFQMVWPYRNLQRFDRTETYKWFDRTSTYKMVWPHRNLPNGLTLQKLTNGLTLQKPTNFYLQNGSTYHIWFHPNFAIGIIMFMESVLPTLTLICWAVMRFDLSEKQFAYCNRKRGPIIEDGLYPSFAFWVIVHSNDIEPPKK